MQTRIYCLFFFLFIFVSAQSQDNPERDSSRVLETVTVQAFGQNKQLKEVSAAVSLINKAQLERFGNTSLVPAVKVFRERS